MSLRKKSPLNPKRSPKSKSFALFSRLFQRDSIHNASSSRNDNLANSVNLGINKSTQENNVSFTKELELDLIYMSRIIEQKVEIINRANIYMQLTQCSNILQKRLSQAYEFVESVETDCTLQAGIVCQIQEFEKYFDEFKNWLGTVNATTLDETSRYFGQHIFIRMEFEARDLIAKINYKERSTVSNFERGGFDNNSFHAFGNRSRFNDEDRRLIERLRQLDQKAIEIPPRKPSLPSVDQDNLDNYLKKLEQSILANQSKPNINRQISNQSCYYSNPDSQTKNTVKVIDNCIMAASIISKDILAADEDESDITQWELRSRSSSVARATELDSEVSRNNTSKSPSTSSRSPSLSASTPTTLDSLEEIQERIKFNAEITPTPRKNKKENKFVFSDEWKPKRSRDIPLPPVPAGSVTERSMKTGSFPSEQRIEIREHGIHGDQRPSKVVSTPINKFRFSNCSSGASPLKSPTFISYLQNCNIKSPGSVLSAETPDRKSINSNQSEKSHNPYRSQLMAKQIPSVVDDPNELLNLTDMQDDINLIITSAALNNSDRNSQTSSNLNNLSGEHGIVSIPTELSQPPSTSELSANNLEQKNGTTECDSEIKSDTEEYYEFFEIDGKKYRRKMKKRIVIEKIKIKKTILAPIKADGSGPDLNGNQDIDQDDLDQIESAPARALNYPEESNFKYENAPQENKDINRTTMQPMRNKLGFNKKAQKRYTMIPTSEYNKDIVPLMTNYMYQFGESNLELPTLNESISQDLDLNQDDPLSGGGWVKTAESNLPHERSRSICYVQKYREQNQEGNTIQSAVRVTACRTVRMKPNQENLEQQSIDNDRMGKSFIPQITETIYEPSYDENLADDPNEAIDNQYLGVGGVKNKSPTHRSITGSLSNSNSTLDEEISDDNHESKGETSHDVYVDLEKSKTLTEDDFNTNVTRSRSQDSSFHSLALSSILPDIADNYSFILTEPDPSPYLIFDTTANNGDCEIYGGPLDALIVYACEVKEHMFLGAFLETYRTFIAPEDLINRLIYRYEYFRQKHQQTINKFNNRDSGVSYESSEHNNTDAINSDNNSGGISKPDYTSSGTMKKSNSAEMTADRKCKHVLSLLLTVIGKLKHDLTDDIREQIGKLHDYLELCDEPAFAVAINKAIESQQHYLELDDQLANQVKEITFLNSPVASHKSSIITNEDELYSNSSINKLSPTTSNSSGKQKTLFSFSSRELAEQITLLDWCKYREVELSEILDLTDLCNITSPGVIGYTIHSDKVTKWTRAQIIGKKSVCDKACTKIIHIMKHLKRLNNFSSYTAMMLVLLTLNSDLYSKKTNEKIEEFKEYMKPQLFKSYYDDLDKATAPCIPYLGLFYQNLTRLNIGNKRHIDLKEKLESNPKWSTSSLENLVTIQDQTGPIINFWRSFKQYVLLKTCNKNQDALRYYIKPNPKILRFINNFSLSETSSPI